MASVDGKSTGQEILQISQKIERAVEAEAVHWKQRARVNLLANGDRNTGAFHTQASKRRKKNKIHRLLDKNGSWKEEEEDKAKVIRDFFSSNCPTREAINEVVRMVDEKISSEDFDYLNKPYSAEEVKKAVFDIHPTKAPGPDGFNAKLFQRFWPAVREFITSEVLAVLNHNASVEEWNHTLIGLIPKIDKPKAVSDFRPLSMCNTSYKIVSKVIVNRLRHRFLEKLLTKHKAHSSKAN